MSSTLAKISLLELSYMLAPVLVVVGIYYRWSLHPLGVLYANSRMLLQLLLVGYVLTYIFESASSTPVLIVLTVMLLAASWIALRPIGKKSASLFLIALASIALSGVTVLIFVTQFVLQLSPWYAPHAVIPLAGMIFSSSMNALSLAAERFESELARGVSLEESRNTAFQAALIPITNSLFAVGLVSLPGMMTGQILSGVDPLIAARYQIVVMTMIFSSSGLSAACYLMLLRRFDKISNCNLPLQED